MKQVTSRAFSPLRLKRHPILLLFSLSLRIVSLLSATSGLPLEVRRDSFEFCFVLEMTFSRRVDALVIPSLGTPSDWARPCITLLTTMQCLVLPFFTGQISVEISRLALLRGTIINRTYGIHKNLYI